MLLSYPPILSAKLKVYISADMEGVVAVVTSEQLGPNGFEYQRFRTFMTNEVLAAIRGAKAAGATEILVSDSHGNGQNLLVEQLPINVELIRSWPRPLGMMEGIDRSFDAVIFIGYHSSTTNMAGVRAHTFSSSTLTDVRLNSTSVSEAGFNAAIAGHFGVPVVMISGDDAIVAEAKDYLGEVEGAIVKKTKSFHAAQTLTPEAAYQLIEKTARRAIERLEDFEPFRLTGNINLEIGFKHYRQAELLAYLSNVDRVDSHTIRFVGNNIVEASMFVQFINGYSSGLSP